MENSDVTMKWLVDCADVAVPASDHPEVLVGRGRTSAPEIRIDDCGESLINVADHLPTHWVYSWLGFSDLANRLALREGVVDRLVRASEELPKEFDIVVLDGWRPRVFQKRLMEYYEEMHQGDVGGYVAESGGRAVPPHTTGGAVDLTLMWRGAPLGLGTDFDAFTAAAAVDSAEGVDDSLGVVRNLRRLLGGVLWKAGLAPYPLEWWHWSFGDQLWAANREEPVAIYGEVYS